MGIVKSCWHIKLKKNIMKETKKKKLRVAFDQGVRDEANADIECKCYCQ